MEKIKELMSALKDMTEEERFFLINENDILTITKENDYEIND